MINYDKQNRSVEKLKKDLSNCRSRSDAIKMELSKIKEVLISTMHEVRRFNSAIYATADSLHKLQTRVGSTQEQMELCETIYYTSGMLSARLGFTDFELNPTQANRQATYRSGIYKKFEKARYVLAQQARARHIQVIFKGNSYSELEALPAFELVPFILLDNALKYSPKNQQVIVVFDEDSAKRRLKVTVKSLGPAIDQGEMESIFSRGVRGCHAESFDGEGLGLYLAKHLCDWHDIKLSASCDAATRFDMEGVPFSDIEMCLEFAF